MKEEGGLFGEVEKGLTREGGVRKRGEQWGRQRGKPKMERLHCMSA